jgi:hypothetical protein
MRILALLFGLGIAAGAIAQDAAKPPAATPELDKDTQTRIRVERSAGGIGKITPEEKAGANLGAGPHRHWPKGAAPREEPETSSDRERQNAATGATR